MTSRVLALLLPFVVALFPGPLPAPLFGVQQPEPPLVPGQHLEPVLVQVYAS